MEVDATVQVSTVSGQIVSTTAGQEESNTIEAYESNFASVDQLAASLKLGQAQNMVVATTDGRIACVARAERSDQSPILVSAASKRLDNVLLAVEVAKTTVANT